MNRVRKTDLLFTTHTVYKIAHQQIYIENVSSNLERHCDPPCQNGGACAEDKNNPGNLICYCPSGYSGEACEYSKYQLLKRTLIGVFFNLMLIHGLFNTF